MTVAPERMIAGLALCQGPGGAAHVPVIDLGALLDVLCPMHLRIDASGAVIHAGPTLLRLRPADALLRRPVLEVFDIARPRGIDHVAALLMAHGNTLRLTFCDAPRTSFKGCLVPVADGAVINLSFGISVLEALQDYALCGRDFAATDMTVEMLYLAEAKSAAIEESRKLNLRLRRAMIAVEEQALTDTLTGLANRRALDQRLSRLERAPGGFALMHLDLDWFKAVNDTLGHAAGDQVLRHVAQVLTEETRTGDTAARLGGGRIRSAVSRAAEPGPTGRNRRPDHRQTEPADPLWRKRLPHRLQYRHGIVLRLRASQDGRNDGRCGCGAISGQA
jgi:hypothetical protein